MCVGESSLELSIQISFYDLWKMDCQESSKHQCLGWTEQMICLSTWYMKYESEIGLLKEAVADLRTGYIRLFHIETKTITTLIGKKTIALD